MIPGIMEFLATQLGPQVAGGGAEGLMGFLNQGARSQMPGSGVMPDGMAPQMPKQEDANPLMQYIQQQITNATDKGPSSRPDTSMADMSGSVPMFGLHPEKRQRAQGPQMSPYMHSGIASLLGGF